MKPINHNSNNNNNNNKESRRGRTRANSSSPPKPRTALFNGPDSVGPHSHKLPPSTASLIDQELVAVRDTVATSSLFEDLQLQVSQDSPNPRSFPYNVKQQCWDKAEKVKGRDPDRWRRDAVGNIVFRKLVGCPGCLCHDYDHILPYSKGGQSTLENCQVLQATVNRSKGNRTELSKADLITRSSYCRVSDRDMDLIELSAYGNVRRAEDAGGCRIQ